MSNSKYPWNEISERAFWDVDSQCEATSARSLKDRLANPKRERYEDVLRDCAQGLAMVMNEIEKTNPVEKLSDSQRVDLLKRMGMGIRK